MFTSHLIEHTVCLAAVRIDGANQAILCEASAGLLQCVGETDEKCSRGDHGT